MWHLQADPRPGLAIVFQDTCNPSRLVLRFYFRDQIDEPLADNLFERPPPRRLPTPHFDFDLSAGISGASCSAVPGKPCLVLRSPHARTLRGGKGKQQMLWVQEPGDAVGKAREVADKLSAWAQSHPPLDMRSEGIMEAYGKPMLVGPVPLRALRDVLLPLGGIGGAGQGGGRTGALGTMLGLVGGRGGAGAQGEGGVPRADDMALHHARLCIYAPLWSSWMWRSGGEHRQVKSQR